MEREIDLLAATINSTAELKKTSTEKNDVQSQLSLGRKLNDLQGALDQTNLNLTQAGGSRRPLVRTRVDRWSDFSFSRYAMGGMDLEELERKQERLKQVDEYLSTLDEIIEQRQQGQPTQGTSDQP